MKSSDLRTDWRSNTQPVPLAVILTLSTALYAYALGRGPLGASEAYSALAASQPTMALVARSALRFDPGKPVLYHLLLHWFCGWFGTSEAALRAFSVLWGTASVWLIFALAREWFGSGAGAAAALIWAFNPFAVVFARWARMYSMFVALALAHVLVLARLRRRGSVVGWILGGLLGAAMLYTHLGAMLILAVDLLVIVREFWRERRSVIWPAVAIAIALFLPVVTIVVSQSRSLLFGHWLDWIGTSHGSTVLRVYSSLLAAPAVLWLMFGGGGVDNQRESLHRCLIYAATPFVILIGVSIAVRPVFAVRYVTPSIAIAAIVTAYILDQAGYRVRNLGSVAVSALFLALVPLYYPSRYEPWPQIAAKIAGFGKPAEPIFFEAGVFAHGTVVSADGDSAFPDGFFRVPFDYYFHRTNPRTALPAGDPETARKLIEAQVNKAGGAWLVSARDWVGAAQELPHGPHLRIDCFRTFAHVLVFHLKLTGGRDHTSGNTPNKTCQNQQRRYSGQDSVEHP